MLDREQIEGWRTFPPDETTPCAACAGEGYRPKCEIDDVECSCCGLARVDCERPCPKCDGRGFV